MLPSLSAALAVIVMALPLLKLAFAVGEVMLAAGLPLPNLPAACRSEERRVGIECSASRSSQYTTNKITTMRQQDRISIYFFLCFQAEDGIRDYKVTGVQTCALPISA